MDAIWQSGGAQAAANQNTAKEEGTGRKWQKLALCCILAVGILATGLWAGITKFGWFDSAIGIETAPTQDEIVTKMSKNLTEQLISDAIAYKNSDDANRDAAKLTMQETAIKRRAYIETLMRENPDEFLRIAITPDIKQELLQDVSGLETLMTLEGTLEIIAQTSLIGDEHDDHDEHDIDCSFDLFLVISEDETKRLYLPESVPVEYGPNDFIRVTGYELNDVFIVDTVADPANFSIILIADMDDEPPASIPRQVAVILVNVENTTIPASFTAASAMTTLNNMNNWYQEVSNNTTHFTGKLNPAVSADIFGTYKVTAANLSANCDTYYSGWHTQARTAAAADGFVATGYQHIMVMINKPSTMPCTWAGRGSVGSTSIWQIGTTSGLVTIHEVGHNFGLSHASRISGCNTGGSVPFSRTQDCSGFSEYGDMYSAMGNSTARGNPAPHFNGIDKYKLGWIPESNMVTVSANGVYELHPIETPSAGLQLIRISLPYAIVRPSSTTSPNGSAPFYYYVEMRAPVGVQNITNTSNRNDFAGVQVRTGAATKYALTYFYQIGGFSGAEPCTGCVTGLRPGMVFKDPHYPNLAIRVLSWTDSKAVVDIRFDNSVPPTCTRSAPSVTVNPASGMVDPGDKIDYTVTVTNNDSSGCANATYTVTPSSTTSGFSYSPTSQPWTLAPGASNSRVFSVTSPSGAADGIYTIRFTAASPDNPSSGTRDVNFVVANTKAIPPTINISGVTDNGTINSNLNTKITATAAHSAGIAKIEIYVNDQLVAKCSTPKNNTCDVFVKGPNTIAGTHLLRVVVAANDTDHTTATLNWTFKR